MTEFKSITDTIREMLESAEYRFQYNEEGNVFILGMNIPSKLSSVRCFLRETSYGFWVNSVSPINGDPNNKEMMRTLLLTPWIKFTGFKSSHLPYSYLKSTFADVWAHEEDALNAACELRCEIDYPCMDEFKPSPELGHAMLAFTTRTWTKFAPCFLAVIFGGKSAEEALKDAAEDADD